MRAINHALTGAIIGVASGNIWVAAPAAVVSHFVLDIIPHHDFGKNSMRKPIFFRFVVIDFIACLIFVCLLFYWRPDHWPLAILCAFLATSPDLMWIPKYMRAKNGHKQLDPVGILKFHHRIQWFQRPIGGYVEVAWFFAVAYLLYAVIHYKLI